MNQIVLFTSYRLQACKHWFVPVPCFQLHRYLSYSQMEIIYSKRILSIRIASAIIQIAIHFDVESEFDSVNSNEHQIGVITIRHEQQSGKTWTRWVLGSRWISTILHSLKGFVINRWMKFEWQFWSGGRNSKKKLNKNIIIVYKHWPLLRRSF